MGKVFPEGVRASLQLTDGETTSNGVLIAVYEPAGS